MTTQLGRLKETFERYSTAASCSTEEDLAFEDLALLSARLMPLLLDAVEVVRSNSIGNAKAEALLAQLDSDIADRSVPQRSSHKQKP